MEPETTTRQYWREGFACASLYALLWLLLADNRGWSFGLVAVSLATALSLLLGGALLPLRLRQLPGFLLLYLRELMLAGWQVACSAFHPRMPIAPAWVTYDLRSGSGRTRMMLAVFVCLLPGTLASRVEEHRMHVHLLDAKQAWRPTVEKIEARLMALLGEAQS